MGAGCLLHRTESAEGSARGVSSLGKGGGCPATCAATYADLRAVAVQVPLGQQLHLQGKENRRGSPDPSPAPLPSVVGPLRAPRIAAEPVERRAACATCGPLRGEPVRAAGGPPESSTEGLLPHRPTARPPRLGALLGEETGAEVAAEMGRSVPG